MSSNYPASWIFENEKKNETGTVNITDIDDIATSSVVEETTIFPSLHSTNYKDDNFKLNPRTNSSAESTTNAPSTEATKLSSILSSHPTKSSKFQPTTNVFVHPTNIPTRRSIDMERTKRRRMKKSFQ